MPRTRWGWGFNGLDLVVGFGWSILRSLLMAGLAMLVVMFWPDRAARIARTVTSQPVAAGGIGLLTAFFGVTVIVVLAITICLSPFSLIGALILGAGLILGWAALGLTVGWRLSQSLKRDWHPATQAGLGTLLLSAASYAFGLIPCVGFIFGLLLAVIGLGAVMMTRFGGQDSLPTPPSTAIVAPDIFAGPRISGPVVPSPGPLLPQGRQQEGRRSCESRIRVGRPGSLAARRLAEGRPFGSTPRHLLPCRDRLRGGSVLDSGGHRRFILISSLLHLPGLECYQRPAANRAGAQEDEPMKPDDFQPHRRWACRPTRSLNPYQLNSKRCSTVRSASLARSEKGRASLSSCRGQPGISPNRRPIATNPPALRGEGFRDR
jgi:hypothetical protein